MQQRVSADYFSVDTQPRRAHELPFGSIVGYTFRRHKLRFMSNAKLRTTTLLRYGSSSQKSAAHIFGNTDCFLLPVCFQSCARLWRTKLLITYHYLTSQKTTKQSLKFFTDLQMRFNAVFNCPFLLHNFVSLLLSQNKKSARMPIDR